MNYWSENVDKYEREKILEGIHTFIGLSFPEFYEDTRKTLPSPPPVVLAGEGEEKTLWNMSRAFSIAKFCSLGKRTLPEYSSESLLQLEKGNSSLPQPHTAFLFDLTWGGLQSIVT